MVSAAFVPALRKLSSLHLPRWLSLVLGLVCLVVGAVLTLRPFTSLSVLIVLVFVTALATGIAEVASAGHTSSPRFSLGSGTLWVAIGVAVALWPGLTISALVIVVGLGLIVSGVLRAFGRPRVVRGGTGAVADGTGAVADGTGVVADGHGAARDQRATAVISGLASVLFGVLALAWPDATVLVIAVVFGARTVLFGISLLIDGIRSDRVSSSDVEAWAWRRTRRRGRGYSQLSASAFGEVRPRRGRARRWSRTLGAIAALIVAILLGSLSAALHKGSPSLAAFYQAPKDVPASSGALVRSEPFTKTVPGDAQAWRILYTTTTENGSPTLASALVVTAKNLPAGPQPVLAWAHGTTGYATACAPSNLADPFGSGALPALEQIISNGWVLVATDYAGLGTAGPQPYLIGQGQARSVLDAVRAAKHLTQLQLADQTVVWGHSQGGNAALWTGQLAASYAPDVHVSGVAALAPASDLPGLIDNTTTVTGGSIFAAYVIAAYSATYPDVKFNDYIRPAARTIVKKTAGRCLSEPEVFVSIASSLIASDKPIFNVKPDTGALGKRLIENTPTGIIQAPVLIAQGEADPLVLPSVQDAYVSKRCALGGGAVDYKTYPGRDHVGVVAPDSPLIADLLSWTQDRLNGKPAPSTC